jgi:hypothetical protein
MLKQEDFVSCHVWIHVGIFGLCIMRIVIFYFAGPLYWLASKFIFKDDLQAGTKAKF